MSNEPVSPALLSEVASRIEHGWRFTVQGNCLHGEQGQGGGSFSIGCGTEEEAQALLDAATAVS